MAEPVKNQWVRIGLIDPEGHPNSGRIAAFAIGVGAWAAICIYAMTYLHFLPDNRFGVDVTLVLLTVALAVCGALMASLKSRTKNK
jgi:hypothetical protein